MHCNPSLTCLTFLTRKQRDSQFCDTLLHRLASARRSTNWLSLAHVDIPRWYSRLV